MQQEKEHNIIVAKEGQEHSIVLSKGTQLCSKTRRTGTQHYSRQRILSQLFTKKEGRKTALQDSRQKKTTVQQATGRTGTQ